MKRTKTGDPGHETLTEMMKFMYATADAGMAIEYDSLDDMLDPDVTRQHHFFHPDEVREYFRKKEIPTPKDCSYLLTICKPGTKVAGQTLKVGWGCFIFERPTITEAMIREAEAARPEAERCTEEAILAAVAFEVERATLPAWTVTILAVPPAALYAAYKKAVKMKDGQPYYSAPWTWRHDCPRDEDAA